MGWFPFTWKRPTSVRPTGRARVAASGTRTSTASMTHSDQADTFDPSNSNNTASAEESRPGFAIVFRPSPHGKAAAHVSQLVAPIAGQQRSGILPSLVGVSGTPHNSPFGRQAASMEETLSRGV
jgi:hypothetical protein